jgi:hypothetical protein
VIHLVARRLALLVPTLFGVLVVTFFLLDVVPATLRRSSGARRLATIAACGGAGSTSRSTCGRLPPLNVAQRPRRPFVTGRPVARTCAVPTPCACARRHGHRRDGGIGLIGSGPPGGRVDRLAMLCRIWGCRSPSTGWDCRRFSCSRDPAPAAAPGAAALPAPAVTWHALGGVRPHDARRDARGAAGDLVRTACAKGLGEAAVVWRHAPRTALIPIITVLALDVGNYPPAVLTETICLAGRGRPPAAIAKRDLPAIQGAVLFLSLVFVLVNLIADLLYAKADPRVAHD